MIRKLASSIITQTCNVICNYFSCTPQVLKWLSTHQRQKFKSVVVTTSRVRIKSYAFTIILIPVKHNVNRFDFKIGKCFYCGTDQIFILTTDIAVMLKR